MNRVRPTPTARPARTIAAFVAAALLTIVAAAPAGATGNWGPIVTLFALNSVTEKPQIVLSADGTTAVAVWARNPGASTWYVQTRVGSVSGNTTSWGPVTTLSQTTAGDAFNPQVAISSDGTRATVVWYGNRTGSSSWVVQARSATISGTTATWGLNTGLSEDGQMAYDPQIDMSDDGTRATVAWYRYDGANWRVQARSATISGTSATWGPTADLSAAGGNAQGPRVKVSSDGTRATAVWYRNNGSAILVQSRSATIAGNAATWGGATNLSAGGADADVPRVALSDDGTKATAVWYRYTTYPNVAIQSRSATIAGNAATWGLIANLTPSNDFFDAPEIAMSADGTKATAVWVRMGSPEWRVQSRSASIAGNAATWGAVSAVSTVTQEAHEPQIALSADGALATTAWFVNTGTAWRAQARTATIAAQVATWAPTVNLSAVGTIALDTRIAVSATGTKAVALWRNNGGFFQNMQVRAAN